MKSSSSDQSRRTGATQNGQLQVLAIKKKPYDLSSSDDAKSQKAKPQKVSPTTTDITRANEKPEKPRASSTDSDKSYKSRQRATTRSVSPAVAKVKKNTNGHGVNSNTLTKNMSRRFSDANALSRRRGSTRSPSRSPSRSRARTRSKSRSRSPSYSRSRTPPSTHSNENYKPASKFQNGNKSNYSVDSSRPNAFKNSSEKNFYNKQQANTRMYGLRTINNQRRGQPARRYQKSMTAQVAVVDESLGRIVSAQRLKNNELQNRLVELRSANEKLVDENRTLKRMHKREEIAIKRFESQDSDMARLDKNHTDETNALRETIKKTKSENKKLYNTLIDKDEEIRALKKKCDELNKILGDKKLLDSVELSKQLEQAERDREHFKAKYDALEKKGEMLEKNHKHEIGVEVAHHRETQRQLKQLTAEMKEMKVRLEEKERALDIANIYTRQARQDDGGPLKPPPSTWKASSQSLNNNGGTAENTPRSRRNEKRHQKRNAPGRQQSKDDSALQSTRNTNRRSNSNEDDEQKDDFIRRQTELEQENRRLREAEARRERELELQREENERLERVAKKQREEQQQQEEKRQRQRRREEELAEKEAARRLEKEKEELEEEERRKRYISAEAANKATGHAVVADKSQKNELLSKLLLIDGNETSSSNGNSVKTNGNGNSNNDVAFNFASANNNAKVNGLPPKPSNGNGYNNRISSEVVENLHEGKPTSVRADSKTDLLSKLFGNSAGSSGGDGNNFTLMSSNPSTHSNGSINNSMTRLEKADDLYGKTTGKPNSKLSTTSTSGNKSIFDDGKPSNSNRSQKTSLNSINNNNNTDTLDFFSKLNMNSTPNNNGLQRKTSLNGDSTNGHTLINRPKIDNLLLVSSNKSNHFIEDIEELTL